MSKGQLSRARGRLRRQIESLRRRLHRIRFICGAWWHGGEVAAGAGLSIDHETVFQGGGRVCIGANVTLGYSLAGFLGMPIVLQPRGPNAEIVIGDGTAIMNGCFFAACQSIQVGANCRIGGGCVFVDSDFHGLRPDERDTPGKTAPIRIGDNVWLGISVTVLKGVTIGKDAVAGAQTVIAKDVPDGAIVVGNPMRIIGSVYDLPAEQ